MIGKVCQSQDGTEQEEYYSKSITCCWFSFLKMGAKIIRESDTEKGFQVTHSWWTILSAREQLKWGCPWRRVTQELQALRAGWARLWTPKASHWGWVENRGRTLPPPNNHQASQDEESGPRSTWGPSEAKIRVGRGFGQRASCCITQRLMALVVLLGTWKLELLMICSSEMVIKLQVLEKMSVEMLVHHK